jgi:L-tryptophan--pyruvate aminotransferase
MFIDLRIGNAAFLKTYWEKLSATPTSIAPDWHLPYAKDTGNDGLHETIIKTHDKLGNAETKGRTVVIGGGATQLLFATSQVLALKNSIKTVYTKPPFYFRFPYIFQSAGLQFAYRGPEKSLEIVCLPSNPMCEVYEASPAAWATIYDLCYNWPTYLDQVQKVNQEIMIFSMAKATGHASSRIGWGLFKNPELAAKVVMQLQYISGGVSMEAQERAKDLLETQLAILENQSQKTVWEYGHEVLKTRWQRVLSLKLNKLKPLNSRGMFLYAEYPPVSPHLDSAVEFEIDTMVKCVAGYNLGGGADRIRINMASSDEDFENFLKALQRIPIE